MVPDLGFPGTAASPAEAAGKRAGCSHCGIPIPSLWSSSIGSRLHWAGTGHSAPEAAGVGDQSLLGKRGPSPTLRQPS